MNPSPENAYRTTHVQTWPGGLRTDMLACEAPLEVRILGQSSTILMRTPGHDEELVRGFLFNEGLINHPDEVVSCGRPLAVDDPEYGNVLAVQLRSSSKITLDRATLSNASCGACGKRTLAAIRVQAPINATRTTVARSVLGPLPNVLREAQTLFAQTGGVHASGLFTPQGTLVAVREDVGRHNALDKLIGWALVEGRVPLLDHVLLLSGRVSFELVQKAIVAGVPIIAAVGAPSSLAVELAERHGLTLVGFLRPDTMNIYTHPERIAPT